MATIALYKSGFNQMPGLIKEVKDSVTDFKAELLALQTKAISIKKSVCDLDNIIDSLQVSTQIQDEKLMSLESFEQNCEEFISEVIHIDSEVADIVKLRKEEFYGAYSYLKPENEKDWKEKAADWFESVGDWCKEHWKELLITVVIVIGAVLAIAAVICSGGLALVPMLTALLTTLGVSAAMATTIATVASLTIAGIAIVSTLGSSALNIVDTWCDMSENSTFKSWQTAMNWISIISNGLYSIGAIYNSVAAKLANVGKGGSGIDFDLSKLSRSQQKAIESADNIINDHLKSSDLSAALGDLQGNPIAKPNGGYWNHAQEVKDAYTGLVRAEKTLVGSLQNPNLAPDVRAFIQGKYDLISNYISIIEEMFATYGGIK